jgi:hypothetical protein
MKNEAMAVIRAAEVRVAGVGKAVHAVGVDQEVR